jgi:hypothetical protein
VVCLFGFWKAGKMHEEGNWNDEDGPADGVKSA